jgi:dTDP-4-dehydrorhamnose 3,5-epimerase
MIFTPLELAGAYRVDIEKREDTRGFFARTFCRSEFSERGMTTDWVQINTSFNLMSGTIRGMHFQRPPVAETKLIRCVRGAVFDVIVDLRAGSAQYGQWQSVELTADNRSAIYIPEGFAHGFQTLEPDTELLYFHSAPYNETHSDGLNPLDTKLAISWPLGKGLLSQRDLALPQLSDLEPIIL